MKEIFSQRTKELTEIYTRAMFRSQSGKLEVITSATFALNTIQGRLDCAEKGLIIDINNVDPAFIELVDMLNQVRSPDQMADYLSRRGNIIDRMVSVNFLDAIQMVKKLMVNEGIAVGISSGANIVAALKIAEEIEGDGKKENIILMKANFRFLL